MAATIIELENLLRMTISLGLQGVGATALPIAWMVVLGIGLLGTFRALADGR
jgi:hypothetical protein